MSPTGAEGLARVDTADLVEPDRLRVTPEPVLVYARTRVELLAGFRDLQRTAALLRLLPDRWAHTLADHLGGPLPGADGSDGSDAPTAAAAAAEEQEDRALSDAARLAAVVDDLRSLEGRALRRVLPDLGDAARHAGARAVRDELRHRSQRRGDPSLNPEAARVFSAVGRLAARSRREPDALIALLLHGVALAPGEALLAPTGLVHLPIEGRTLQVRRPAALPTADPLAAPVFGTPEGGEVAARLGIAPGPAPRLEPSVRTRHHVVLVPPGLGVSLTVGEAGLLPDAAAETARARLAVALDAGVTATGPGTGGGLPVDEVLALSPATVLTGSGRVAVITASPAVPGPDGDTA